MRSGLTATMDLGLPLGAMRQALRMIPAGVLRSLGRDETAARSLGIGTVQVEALGAWMRLSGLVRRDQEGLALSALGEAVLRHDAGVVSEATWWALHANLSACYTAWFALATVAYGACSLEQVEAAMVALVPGSSARTLKNARTAILRTLEDTPIGQQIGLYRLETDGRRTTSLTKLSVRYGQAPMAAVAYAIVDWARRERLSSVSLTSLAAADGVGPILHMSEGVLERYLIEIDGAFRGRALSYSRTANLNEAYVRDGVTPLQVLVSHYLHEQDGLEWPGALERAAEEVPAADGDQ